MKKAIVDVESRDYQYFETLMKKQGFDCWEWANEGEEYPDEED